ncbi:hypothetical protein K523DRAFT_252896 [Schizophyllum commune Tattone D]|nr:hypothetical protein K523DRAFT_252896 [Schizophyllum commune Tattone D]
MPDFGVHVTIINDTDKGLQNDGKGTTADWGGWVNVPAYIGPKSTSASFTLEDHAGPSGSEGYLSYFVNDDSSVDLRTYQTCPWGDYDNKISITTSPPPTALYEVNFRAHSGDGQWQYNTVQTSGHPVYVEYTLAYQSKRYRFRLDRVAAKSAHPVRNSRDELLIDDHELWTRDDPAKYKDGKVGSLAPNVFAYDFKSPVADSSHLAVTVTPLDAELAGAEVIVYGSVNGKIVFQTDYFFLGLLVSKTVSAHPILPKTSDRPFAWNADVEWHMELRFSRKPVEASGPYTTELELYWVAESLHRAFKNGIPVSFLRQVLKRAPNLASSAGGATVQIVNEGFYQTAADDTFNNCCKIYDTTAGQSAFGMAFWGGTFDLTLYLQADDSGVPGSLFRYVNCMDQAGMLQLSCSLLGDTSWLGQQPFGYIHTTHLVGVADGYGNLINVNNPFFGTEPQYALVDQNAPARTGFFCHVYVGNSKPFVSASDAIYDACSGPHAGTEIAQEYVTNSIDATTTLYSPTYIPHPGTVQNIAMGPGVVGIDGQHFAHAAADTRAAFTAQAAGSALDRLLAPGGGSTDASDDAAAASIAHTDWAHLPEWLPSVLGADWTVQFARVGADTQRAHALYQLADRASGHAVRVRVSVHTQTGADGALDPARSAAAAREAAAHIVGGTDRTPDALWVAGGALGEYGDWSLQYRPEVGAGRFLVCAGNTVVDIAGLPSTAALAEVARRLLGRVVQHDAPLPGLPVLADGAVTSQSGAAAAASSSSSADIGAIASGDVSALTSTSPVQIAGAGTRFSLSFVAESQIAAAGATSDSGGLIFDKYTVEEYVPSSGEAGADSTSAPLTTVVFVFYAKEIGHHTVRIHVADAKTMLTATRVVGVDVV